MPDSDPATVTAAGPADESGLTGSFHAPDDPPPAHPPALPAGEVVAGRYKLLEPLGEGGMGSVFLAQQSEPVRRFVALKVIRSGMDSRVVLARFEAERQALALMDHPNIAKVLDAGTTEAGRPFFVMELVAGAPVTDYCDAHRLAVRGRLELFVAVCRAVQHAHQKGVIHRDIKPSNVLVTEVDGRAVPKVIDFGVAKATGAALTDSTLQTGAGAVVGTPEYMSPEQASLDAVDVDTRSDVYALGVLLYELLTGSTPVDRKSLGQVPLLEVLRVVREVEAPRPSARLAAAADLPATAARRRADAHGLCRHLRGELDWVALKALEKDRARRYDTANALARDVERYLADEVVEARPPSAGYRLRKFARRNKGRVAAAGLVLLALVAGLAGTTWGLVRAERETARAIKAEDDAVEQAKVAGAERDKALAAADAERRAKEAEAEQRRSAVRAHQWVSHAFSWFIGDVLSLNEFSPKGDFPQRINNIDLEAVASRILFAAENSGTVEGNPDRRMEGLLNAAELLSHVHPSTPFSDAESVRSCREAISALQAKTRGQHSPVDDESLARGYMILSNLKVIESTEKLRTLRAAVSLLDRLSSQDPRSELLRERLCVAQDRLTHLLLLDGDAAGAVKARRAVVALREKLAVDNPAALERQVELAKGRTDLGSLLAAIGDTAGAEKMYRQVAMAKGSLRDKHWNRALAYDRLYWFREGQADWDRAVDLSPAGEKRWLRAARANSRLRAGRVAEAVADVAELTKTDAWDAGEWYDFACVYAVASVKDAAKRDEYVARAVGLLGRAVKAGYANAAHMAADSDLDPLRDRADFRALLAEAEAKENEGREPVPREPAPPPRPVP